MRSERGAKHFLIWSEKNYPKTFLHVGLSHFLTPIENGPGTMEGLADLHL